MLKMLGSLLLPLIILPSALPQFTISPVNRVTAQPTTTETYKYFAAASRARGETQYTFKGKFGEISCRTAETALSNCDTLEILRPALAQLGDEHTYIDSVQQQQGRHLASLEERVLEVLGQLQEVQGTLHSRPERSAGANRVCETVHNATRALETESETVENRQAVAELLVHFSCSCSWLVPGKIVLYIKKCMEKHRAAALEADLLEMESWLPSRKAKKRSAASRAKGRSSPASPTQE